MLSDEAMNSIALMEGLNRRLNCHQVPNLSVRDEVIITVNVSTTRPVLASNESTYVQRFPRAKGIGGFLDSAEPTPLSLHDGTEATKIKMAMILTTRMMTSWRTLRLTFREFTRHDSSSGGHDFPPQLQRRRALYIKPISASPSPIQCALVHHASSLGGSVYPP